jgi:hypothetical protein
MFLNIRILEKKYAYRTINNVSYHFTVTQNIPVTSELLPQTEWRLPLARKFVPCSTYKETALIVCIRPSSANLSG